MLRRRSFVGKQDFGVDTGTLCCNFLDAAESGDVHRLTLAWRAVEAIAGALSPDDVLDRDTAQGICHIGAATGSVAVLQWLHDNGGSLTLRDGEGCQPAHHAAAAGHVSVLEWLLPRGGELRQRDSNGLTPLHYATMGGQRAAVGWLRRNVLDTDAEDADGERTASPWFSAQRGRTPVTDLTRDAMKLSELRSHTKAGPVTAKLWREVVAVFAFPALLAGPDVKPLPWLTLPPPDRPISLLFSDVRMEVTGGMLYAAGDYQLGCHAFVPGAFDRGMYETRVDDGDGGTIHLRLTALEHRGQTCPVTIQVFSREGSRWKLLRLCPSAQAPGETVPRGSVVSSWVREARRRSPLIEELDTILRCPGYVRDLFLRVPAADLRSSSARLRHFFRRVHAFSKLASLTRKALARVSTLQRKVRGLLGRRRTALDALLRKWQRWQDHTEAVIRERMERRGKAGDLTGAAMAQIDLESVVTTDQHKVTVMEQMLRERRLRFHARFEEWKRGAAGVVVGRRAEVRRAFTAAFEPRFSYALDLDELLRRSVRASQLDSAVAADPTASVSAVITRMNRASRNQRASFDAAMAVNTAARRLIQPPPLGSPHRRTASLALSPPAVSRRRSTETTMVRGRTPRERSLIAQNLPAQMREVLMTAPGGRPGVDSPALRSSDIHRSSPQPPRGPRDTRRSVEHGSPRRSVEHGSPRSRRRSSAGPGSPRRLSPSLTSVRHVMLPDTPPTPTPASAGRVEDDGETAARRYTRISGPSWSPFSPVRRVSDESPAASRTPPPTVLGPQQSPAPADNARQSIVTWRRSSGDGTSMPSADGDSVAQSTASKRQGWTILRNRQKKSKGTKPKSGWKKALGAVRAKQQQQQPQQQPAQTLQAVARMALQQQRTTAAFGRTVPASSTPASASRVGSAPAQPAPPSRPRPARAARAVQRLGALAAPLDTAAD